MWMESEGHKWFHFMMRAEAAVRTRPGLPRVLGQQSDMSGASLGKYVASWLGNVTIMGIHFTFLLSFHQLRILYPVLVLVWHPDHEPLMLVSAWTLYKVLQCSQHIISFMAHGQTGRGIIVCCNDSNLTSCFVSQLHSLARHLIDQPNAELSHCHRACWRKTWIKPDLSTNTPILGLQFF